MAKRITCCVVQSHKRILEAHRLWHQAFDNYFDPEGFRTNINAAIQALRNVTFAIQNEKAKIPNFEQWYPKWVERLKQNDIMRWLCDARTDIVHKKDLEFYSIATVSIMDYVTYIKSDIRIPLFLSGKSIIRYLCDEGIIDNRMQNSDLYAVIDRKWIVKQFPKHDMLFILAYGIGTLYTMIEEAHNLSQSNINSCSVVDTMHAIQLGKNAMPECMTFPVESMQEKIGLRDLLNRTLTTKKVEYDPQIASKLIKRYRVPISVRPESECLNPFDFATKLYEWAKIILKKDRYHTALIHAQKQDGSWVMNSPIFEDRTSKYIFWNDFAEQVRKENYIAIIFICEVWIGEMEIFKQQGLFPSDQPNAKEALRVDILTKDFREKSFVACFRKNKFGKLFFEDEYTEDNPGLHTGYLAPVAKVWRDLEEDCAENTSKEKV